jgi:YD repeat-containing protein
MRTAISFIIIFLIVNCITTKDEESVNEFTAHYFIDSYHDDSDDPNNFISTKYYDSTGKLLREVTRDGHCIQYIYNKNNQLSETVTGRNCTYGRRSIFMYDSLGNHLGIYNTMDSVINLNTIIFEQTKYYDSSNRLIKEKVSERQTMNGEVIETWNLYKYDSNLRTSLEVIENDITIWYGTYTYDSTGNFLQLNKNRNERYEIETFVYNSIGQLVEKEIKNNEKLVTSLGTFNKPERRTVFKYDSTNFLYEETIYHDEKFLVKTIHKMSSFERKSTP